VSSYFVCATPRTGSSLLCGLLASSGVAGYPESYFRAQDEALWASRFGLGGSSTYLDFVRQAKAHGTTNNGVFGARVMWGTLNEVIGKLKLAAEPGSDLDTLHACFGELEFVYLRREDVLAQAVSWALAENSGVWHVIANEPRSISRQSHPFDRTMIAELMHTIDDHNRAWCEWFASVGVTPHEVCYEDLDEEPLEICTGVLQDLEIDPPATALEVRFQRLRDEVNDDWIRRHRRRATRILPWR
jgi:LPS sulfotransferase NodH